MLWPWLPVGKMANLKSNVVLPHALTCCCRCAAVDSSNYRAGGLDVKVVGPDGCRCQVHILADVSGHPADVDERSVSEWLHSQRQLQSPPVRTGNLPLRMGDKERILHYHTSQAC